MSDTKPTALDINAIAHSLGAMDFAYENFGLSFWEEQVSALTEQLESWLEENSVPVPEFCYDCYRRHEEYRVIEECGCVEEDG